MAHRPTDTDASTHTERECVCTYACDGACQHNSPSTPLPKHESRRGSIILHTWEMISYWVSSPLHNSERSRVLRNSGTKLGLWTVASSRDFCTHNQPPNPQPPSSHKCAPTHGHTQMFTSYTHMQAHKHARTQTQALRRFLRHADRPRESRKDTDRKLQQEGQAGTDTCT